MVETNPEALVNRFKEEMDPTITGITLGILVVFSAARFALPDTVPIAIADTRTFLTSTFGPLFLVLMLIFVLFCLVIIVGPWGSIRLGGPNATPSYTYPAYFAMFFSAGIAAGIVFWGPSEAMFHFTGGSPFYSAQPGSSGAVAGAIKTTMFHWGFSAWSSYVAIGVPIAYYAYNKGAPLRISSLLMPFLGRENLDHPIGKFIDILAVFATIGGVATSVGFVSQQFRGGVQYIWNTDPGTLGMLVIFLGMTVVFTVSVVTGVKRGIRRIAAVNFGLFALMAAVLLVAGPTLFIITNGSVSFAQYLVDFIPISLYPPLMTGSASQSAAGFMSAWTIFYWVWWFSWAPFAGLFLAAISKGRTLRTVTATGVFATGIATLVWFAIMSGISLNMEQVGTVITADGGTLSAVSPYSVMGFAMLQQLPAGSLLAFVFFALIITWIVTSADTSTLTVSILASKQGVAPTMPTRVFWGFVQGAVGAGIVIIGGGGNALQSAAVITGGPFGLIALVGIIGLGKEFASTEVEGQSVVGAAQDALNGRSD